MFRAHLVTLAALCGACAATTPPASAPAESAAAPAPAARLPDFTLNTLDGDRFSLSDHVGRDVIVISFWATWCAPCLNELPHLSELYEREKEQGLVVVAVSMDEPNTQAEVAPMARRLGLEMPVVIDAEQRAVRLYNKGRDAPMTVVIDRGGRIVKAQSGFNPGDEVRLEKQVMALLAS
ncbi:MAG: TlpA disulfide reductase family protein [Myxococcota bacterium]